MNAIGVVLQHVSNGRKYGYPSCCIMAFTLDRLLRPEYQSAIERGFIDLERGDGTVTSWVTCEACMSLPEHQEWE